MSASVFVGFATEYGSTQEVAENIAEILRKEGLKVEVQPVRKVSSLEGFQAVVLGAPLYMFRWHNDARRFLSKHQKILKSLPVAIFALGPFHNNDEQMQGARTQLDKELAKYPWLSPVTIELFPGKFDPGKLRFPYSLIVPLKKMPASDERDWAAIQSWASSLAGQLLVKQG